MREKSTKKAKAAAPAPDEMRSEYRRETLGKGVRGKYFNTHAQGTNLILLQPEVAKAFTTLEAVNEALPTLVQVA